MYGINKPVLNHGRQMELNFTSAKDVCETKLNLGNILQTQGYENKRIRLRLIRLGMKDLKITLI
jgi:hypothetical protein